MLLAQVEGFIEIARQGNMRRAAYALSIGQPALTARLQALEEELGAALFRRTHSGMVLTPAGRAFLPHADRAMEAIRSGRSLVRELEQGVIGELALAVAPAVSAYVLPEILVRFTERHPDVRLLVRTGHSEEIVDLVAHGQVELGIVRQIRDARVRSRPLYEDELVLVARPDHPFAAAGAVDVSEISHAQLILFDRTSSYYDVTNALFRVAGVYPAASRRSTTSKRPSGWSSAGSVSRCSPGLRSQMRSRPARFGRSSWLVRRRSGDGSWRSSGPELARRPRSWIPCGDSSIGSRSLIPRALPVVAD